MEFDFIAVEGIPLLSWCAEITNSSIVKIYHGEGVEITGKAFVEGAWDGDYQLFNFDKANFFIGSGGRINATNDLIFSTSSHTLERLLAVSTKQGLYLSNSLPLLLTLSNTQLKPGYIHYERDFCSIVHGLNNYTKAIPLKNQHKLILYYYCNLKIEQLNIIEFPKEKIKPFKDFTDYRNRLNEAIRLIITNSKAKARNHRYGIVTTVSQGYDAAASAAIVKNFDCNTALTFNAPNKYEEDSGEEIATILGYTHIVTKNAHDYLDNQELLEAEFVASGELGTSVIFTAFEDEFKGNIVVTGESGDYFWNKNEFSNNEFKFTEENLPQISMIEHRLRIGYLVLPIPYYGAVQWESLHQISNSNNMLPYSIGGDYDRPIPRKFLEDAGVARHLFANKNIGAGVNYRYDNLPRLKSRMSSTSFAHFYQYYQHHKRNPLLNLVLWTEFLWESRLVYANFFLKKIRFPKNFKETYPLIPNPGPPSYLIQWGVATLSDRLKAPIQQAQKHSSSTII